MEIYKPPQTSNQKKRSQLATIQPQHSKNLSSGLCQVNFFQHSDAATTKIESISNNQYSDQRPATSSLKQELHQSQEISRSTFLQKTARFHYEQQNLQQKLLGSMNPSILEKSLKSYRQIEKKIEGDLIVNQEEIQFRQKLVRVHSSSQIIKNRRDISHLNGAVKEYEFDGEKYLNIQKIIRSISNYDKAINSKQKNFNVQLQPFQDQKASIFTFDQFLSDSFNLPPANRKDAQLLTMWIDQVIIPHFTLPELWDTIPSSQQDTKLLEMKIVIDQALQELVNQVTVNCKDRGQLLKNLLTIVNYVHQRRYRKLYEEKYDIQASNNNLVQTLNEAHNVRITSLQNDLTKLEKESLELKSELSQLKQSAKHLEIKLDITQERNAQILLELRNRENQIGDIQWDLKREVKFKTDTKLAKNKIENEINQLRAENDEMKESLLVGETLRIKQQEIIDYYEMRNKERTKGEEYRKSYSDINDINNIADAVKSFQKAVSQRISSVIRKSVMPTAQVKSMNSSQNLRQKKQEQPILEQISEAVNIQTNQFEQGFDKPQQEQAASTSPKSQASKRSEDQVTLTPLELVSKEEENLRQMLMKFEDDEEKFIRMEFQVQQTQDELLNNDDFKYLLKKSEDLFSLYYNPAQAKKQQNPYHMMKLMAEITKQLFSNEIQVIAGLAGEYNEKINQIQSGKSIPLKSQKSTKVYRHPIYLNNPNFVKKKRLVVTKDQNIQTEHTGDVTKNDKSAVTEAEIENKVASKLVSMLVNKGVSKIIKKYGYLPVDYLKNEQRSNALEMTGYTDDNKGAESKRKKKQRSRSEAIVGAAHGDDHHAHGM